MKIYRHLSLLLVISMFIVGCTKDPIEQGQGGIVPSDEYVGSNRLISLEDGCLDFSSDEFVLALRTPSGEVIRRSGEFSIASGSHAKLSMHYGVKDGIYQLLHLEYKGKDREGNDVPRYFGLGCSISFSEGEFKLLSRWNPKVQMYGSGTEVDTIYISSADHMVKLQSLVNTFTTNEQINHDYYFLQIADIDGDDMANQISWEYGWLPIGSQPEVPFRSTFDGGGYKIRDLWIDRDYMAAAALFGCAESAYFCNINMVDADIRGGYGVGGIVGVILSGANDIDGTFVENCTVSDSKIQGDKDGSFGVGGLVGVVDMRSGLLITGCKSLKNTISATHQAGGVIGAGSRTSSIVAYMCENSSPVSSDYNSCGGIVAVCDTLYAGGCINSGKISGAKRFTTPNPDELIGGTGAGGIAGGTGLAYFITCENYGEVTGHTGVGGILGSSRITGAVDGEQYICNNAAMASCKNEGAIGGVDCVGGLCGEAQFGSYGSYNKGSVIAQGDFAGGLVASAPVVVAHNNLNLGYVQANSYAGGIVGRSCATSLAVNQNLGDIYAEISHAAGIIASSGNDSTLTYSCNFGEIKTGAKAYCSGIVGEYGAPDEAIDWALIAWTVTEVAASYVGVAFAHIPATKDCNKLTTASIIWGFSTCVVDSAIAIYGISDIVKKSKSDKLTEETLAEINRMGAKIAEEMKAQRDLAELDAAALGVSEEYEKYIDIIVTYLEESQNLETFSDELNKERERLMEEVHKMQMAKDIFHTCVSGLAIAISLAGSICAVVGTGGVASAAVAGAWVGAVGATIGGANTMWQTLTDYEQNIVFVDQSANFGTVNPGSSDKESGGIVAKLNSYGRVSDCINVGSGASSGGHIVGYLGNVGYMTNCLSVAPLASWGSGVYADDGKDTTMSGVYYYDPNSASDMMQYSMTRSFDGATPLNATQLASPESYQGWDFDSSKGRWAIAEGSQLSFPIPFVSRYTIATQDNQTAQ